MRIETITRETSGPCYQGLLFEVAADRAEEIREMLKRIGMKPAEAGGPAA